VLVPHLARAIALADRPTMAEAEAEAVASSYSSMHSLPRSWATPRPGVEDKLLLIVGVLGDDIRRGLLRVVCVPRKGLRGGFIAREPGTRHLDDPSLGVGVVCHCCVLAEHHRQCLIKDAVGGKQKTDARERPFPRAREAARGKWHRGRQRGKWLAGSLRGGTWRR
jgi:hypothetical protein